MQMPSVLGFVTFPFNAVPSFRSTRTSKYAGIRGHLRLARPSSITVPSKKAWQVSLAMPKGSISYGFTAGYF